MNVTITDILGHDGKLDAAELTWLAANYPAQKITVLWSDGKETEENARHTLQTIGRTLRFGANYVPVDISLTMKARWRLMLDAKPAPKLP